MIAGFCHAQESAMTHRRYSRSLREIAERKKRRSAPASLVTPTQLFPQAGWRRHRAFDVCGFAKTGSADFVFFEVCGFLWGRTASEFQQIETLRYLTTRLFVGRSGIVQASLERVRRRTAWRRRSR